MSKKKFRWSLSATTITFSIGTKVFAYKKNHPNYKKAMDLIKADKIDELESLIADPFKASKGLFSAIGDRVYMKGFKDPLPKKFGHVIYDFYKSKKNIKPLINFWRNLAQNPLETAKESLFDFIAHNDMAITPDGCFIAYKKVTRQMSKKGKSKRKFVDSHTKTIDNSVGKVVKMARKDVDANIHQTCSRGLHVAAWSYAATYDGDVLVCVKVNPKNVVAVPSDYNRQKMRVCEYKVCKVVSKPYEGYYIQTDDKEEFDGMTSKEIIAFVRRKTGKRIRLNPKNKKAVLREAKRILEGK